MIVWVRVAALVVLAACGRQAEQAPTPTARAERVQIERVVVATGTIEPEKEVEVRPRISGIVEVVHVKAGDRVTALQPLVEIDRELLAAQLREAQAQLASAEIERRFGSAESQRTNALHEDGIVAAQDHDRSTARYEQAKAAVAKAHAAVETLEVQLQYTTVTAPMAGTILDVDVKEGSAVASVASVTGGTRLLTLAVTDTLHLKGLVDENEIAFVRVGQPARIRTESFGARTFAGVVQEIKPIGERQQNVTYFEVKVRVSDPEATLLRPRMSGDADIVAAVVDDALVVPETALLNEGEGIFVERPAPDGGGTRVPVQLGIIDGARVQVLQGLAAGDEVRLK
jgi:HlyD family secretion protein